MQLIWKQCFSHFWQSTGIVCSALLNHLCSLVARKSEPKLIGRYSRRVTRNITCLDMRNCFYPLTLSHVSLTVPSFWLIPNTPLLKSLINFWKPGRMNNDLLSNRFSVIQSYPIHGKSIFGWFWNRRCYLHFLYPLVRQTRIDTLTRSRPGALNNITYNLFVYNRWD